MNICHLDKFFLLLPAGRSFIAAKKSFSQNMLETCFTTFGHTIFTKCMYEYGRARMCVRVRLIF